MKRIFLLFIILGSCISQLHASSARYAHDRDSDDELATYGNFDTGTITLLPVLSRHPARSNRSTHSSTQQRAHRVNNDDAGDMHPSLEEDEDMYSEVEPSDDESKEFYRNMYKKIGTVRNARLQEALAHLAVPTNNHPTRRSSPHPNPSSGRQRSRVSQRIVNAFAQLSISTSQPRQRASTNNPLQGLTVLFTQEM